MPLGPCRRNDRNIRFFIGDYVVERFELDEKLQDEIRTRVMGEGFMKIVQTVRRNGKLFKIVMRPVLIGGVRKFQAEMTDEGQVRVKNFNASDAADGLEEIIAQRGARELHLMTASGDLHVRVTKKGKALVSRSAEMNRTVTIQPHDRVKKQPLTSFDSTALLRTIGISDGEGDTIPSFFREYKFKLEKLYEKFYTKAGCAMAAQRRQIARDFYEALYREVNCGYADGQAALDAWLTI